MTSPPPYRKVNPADAPVLPLTLAGGDVPLYRLNDGASTIIAPALSRVAGVAQVQTFGEQLYAVRVRLDPARIASMGLAFDTVGAAIQAANRNAPIGLRTGEQQQLTLRANDQPQNAREFCRIVVAGRASAPVRLGDIAEVADGVQNERVASWRDGTRALVLAVQRQPDANTVEVVDGVPRALPTLQSALPPGASLGVTLDRSVSIRDAVRDVQHHLVIAIGLVGLVCFLFLRRLSATLIPTVAVPIDLAVTFGLMYPLGYGIDYVTLLALTIAVGLVVDDAIVVLEAIIRHVEAGMEPVAAAIKGPREVGFAVLSITRWLIAVFRPILLMGGVVGRVFNAFAATVSRAVIASLVVSLTVTPLMASRLRAPKHGGRPGLVKRTLERALVGFERGYAWLLDRAPRWRLAVWLAFLLSSGRRVARGSTAQGLLPGRGHGPAQRQHGGATRGLHRGDGARAGARRRDHPGLAACRERRLLRRRGWRLGLDQPGADVRPAHAARRAAGRGRGDPLAAVRRELRAGHARLPPADPEPRLRRAAVAHALHLHAAGASPRRAARVGAAPRTPPRRPRGAAGREHRPPARQPGGDGQRGP